MQPIQQACVKEARRLGYKAIKMPVHEESGLPDYQFIGYNSHIFWVEFKRPGERVRPRQRRVIKQMTEMGQEVYIIDNVDDFYRIPKPGAKTC